MAENMENKLPPRAPGKPPVNSAPPKPAPAAPKQPPKPAPAPKAAAVPATPPKPVSAAPGKPAPAAPSKPTAPAAPGKPAPVPKQPPKQAPKPEEAPKAPEAPKSAEPEKKAENLETPKVEETKPEEQKPEQKPEKPEKKAAKNAENPVNAEAPTAAPENEVKAEVPEAPKPKKEKKAKDNKAKAEEVKSEAAPEDNKPEEKVDKEKSEESEKPKKPERPKKSKVKDGAVADKNLKVVEKALSVEELNQLKQRRIRNAIYALAAVVLVLVIVLIVIIFWPTEERVEAQYDLTYESVPSVSVIEHSIYSEEVTGNIITFKKPLTISPADMSTSGFSSFIMNVIFEDALGNDVTDQMYIRLSENYVADIYNLESIKSTTVGELENVPNHQIYVDLAIHDFVYFSNALTAGDEAFPVLLGFLCKNPALLADEIIMKVSLYGFNSETIVNQINYDSNGVFVTASDGTRIGIDTDWAFAVSEAVSIRKFGN